MKIRALGKTLTIEVNLYFDDDKIAQRRRLAARVALLAESFSAPTLYPCESEFNIQISRIKAARSLNVVGDDDGRTSLKAAKTWVEAAFLDNGKGSIA